MKIVYANISMFAKLWPQIEPTSSDLSTPITTITSFTIKKTITENVVDFDQTFKCETCNAIFNYREESRRHTIDKHESKQKKKKRKKIQRLLAVMVCVCSTYHLTLSLKLDHHSRKESLDSASNSKNPLYSVPHA
jgi:uncharacterized C2H2 Zn-finger protein